MQARTRCCRIIHPTHLLKYLYFYCVYILPYCVSAARNWVAREVHHLNAWGQPEVKLPSRPQSCRSVHLGTRSTQWLSGYDDARRALLVVTPPAWIQAAGTGAQETRSLCWRVFVATMGVNTSKFLEVLLH